MQLFSICLVSLFLLASAEGHANEHANEHASEHASEEVTGTSVTDHASVSIRNRLKALASGIRIKSVTETPLKGIFEVILSDNNVLYASADGQYLFQGDMLKLENNKINNLTNEVRIKGNRTELAKLSKKDMIIFSPEGEVKGVIYVFTDVDCGYCRKLHAEVGELNSLGIELRYLAFPRGGPRSPVYKKMVSLWCANDPRQAMNILKSGGSIPEKSCINPIDNQYKLGVALGVHGTPAIFLEDGTPIAGYLPARDIASRMGLAPRQDAARK